MWFRLLPLFLLSTLVVTRQVFLKVGLDRMDGFSFSPFLENLLALFTSPWIVAALTMGLFTSLFWFYLLSRMPLSVAATVLGVLCLVMRMMAASVLLGEPVPSTRWLGMAVAAAGIVLMAR